MIRRTKDRQDRQQGVRHEWVTILMLRSLREWLLPAVGGSETDFAIVEWAVCGHHPAHDHASPPKDTPTNGASGPEISLLCSHTDFRASLEWLARMFKLEPQPLLTHLKLELGTNGQVFPVIKAWEKASRKLWETFSNPNKLHVAAVKDCLVAADIAGSALPRSYRVILSGGNGSANRSRRNRSRVNFKRSLLTEPKVLPTGTRTANDSKGP